MRLPIFTHRQPADFAGVVSALTEGSGAKVLAGGTDLLVNMKHRIEMPEKLVSLKKVADIRGINLEGDATVIGAATTLKEIRQNSELERKFPALVQAAMSVGSYRHQAMGTLGGNLCQNTRCRFFNQSWQWRQARSLCYKVGGEDCHVIGRKHTRSLPIAEMWRRPCSSWMPPFESPGLMVRGKPPFLPFTPGRDERP